MPTDRSTSDTERFDARRNGWTVEDHVEEIEEHYEHDVEEFLFYTTYSDVYHTSAECPHIQDSESVWAFRGLHSLQMAAEPYCTGPKDVLRDLDECSWCEDNTGGPEPMTDGGTPSGGTERRDPTDDPTACSRCGVHIGLWGDDYCDPCAREIGSKPPMQRCMGCGQYVPQELMESVDISPQDEYYPTIRYLCQCCSGGERDV